MRLFLPALLSNPPPPKHVCRGAVRRAGAAPSAALHEEARKRRSATCSCSPPPAPSPTGWCLFWDWAARKAHRERSKRRFLPGRSAAGCLALQRNSPFPLLGPPVALCARGPFSATLETDPKQKGGPLGTGGPAGAAPADQEAKWPVTVRPWTLFSAPAHSGERPASLGTSGATPPIHFHCLCHGP